MRRFLIPLMLIASVGGTSVAMAGESRGSIHSLDSKACTLTLEGGKSAYHFMPGCDFSKLKVGERVAIKWTAAGTVRLASAINAG